MVTNTVWYDVQKVTTDVTSLSLAVCIWDAHTTSTR
jgi:hypothetical protein